MSQPSDRQLIKFIKQYRPFPPPATENLERQLFNQITLASNSVPQPSFAWFWLVPSTLIVGLLIWTGSRWWQPSPQPAVSSTELETFLVESWQGTINESSLEEPSQTMTSDWLLISDPHP